MDEGTFDQKIFPGRKDFLKSLRKFMETSLENSKVLSLLLYCGGVGDPTHLRPKSSKCYPLSAIGVNPLNPNSDRDQFSLNNIHTLSRDLIMRINKVNTYCFALIFYQILSTHSLRKYIKISLENLYVDIMGLKGLICVPQL